MSLPDMEAREREHRRYRLALSLVFVLVGCALVYLGSHARVSPDVAAAVLP